MVLVVTNVYVLHNVRNLDALRKYVVIIVEKCPMHGPFHDSAKNAYVGEVAMRGRFAICAQACDDVRTHVGEVLIRVCVGAEWRLNEELLAAFRLDSAHIENPDELTRWLREVFALQKGEHRIELVTGNADLERLVPEAYVAP